ncbi:M14 family zinc carboxypeptidase [Micromonospora yasonensis]|uniref:M14 family zinc carboxypeptidase n=1 Tax=Micromonospora yasonensis TaxID=1128667 RepID=UPI0022318727|nr:M14 family zinc carboxypeptidase [Micromonospora yasonensis]MCW3844224.1 M14 family zinc carboxypeptidase [Micromonospora yasonensis]
MQVNKMSTILRSRGALAAAVTAALAGSILTAPPVSAAAPEGPGQGSCKIADDPSWSGWSNHQQVGEQLTQLERTSGGRVKVEVAGRTQQGRELWAARVGTGDKVLLVTSAIHGNERTGTEALLAILKRLGGSGDAQTRKILSEITFVAMPMVNPDGGELNRRMNVRSWDETVAEFPQLAGAPRAWYHRLSGDGIDLPGYDLNRDFNPDLNYVPRAADLPGRDTDAGFFLSPESRAIRDVYVGLRAEKGAVDAYVDLHHMGPCDRLTGGEQDGNLISVSLDYPPLGVQDGAKYKAAWPALDQDKSRRYALTVANGMKAQYGSQSKLAAVGRYFHPDAREYAGQGRSAFALNGTGTVLFEVRGQQDDLGQKQHGMLVKSVQTGVESLLGGLADGTVDQVDGDHFFDLPDYGWDTTND